MEDDLGVKIGLEIHVPLDTRQKLFCDCPTNYYEVEEPNTNICPVCTGMPGSKPWPINSRALDTVVMIARLLNCEIRTEKKFVKRKHYDYPDLPSGYQRTSEPIGINGSFANARIWEIHIEEDPGRYDLQTGRIDYNRSGVPLAEIVTAPDMNSPEDARNFLKELMNLLRYTERIIDVGGVLRADVNISLAGGSKVEIKNINSVKGAYKAIKYEIIRQRNMRKRGVNVKQETRGYNERSMTTISMRVKETADDYRYIPDPDIPPLVLEQDYINGIKLPETPQTRKKRLIEKYKVEEKYAKILIKDKDIADMFEEISRKVDAGIAAPWVCREVMRQLNYRGIELRESKLNSKIMIELLELLSKGEITDNVGKKILERVIDSGEGPGEVVRSENLGKISGSSELSRVADEVIQENPQAIADYKAGKRESLNFLMGRVMQKMRGRAAADVVIKLLRERL